MYSNLTDEELRSKARSYDNLHNEGNRDGYNPYEDELGTRLDARIEAGCKADADNFPIEWTKEVTATRRTAWNAEVKAGRITCVSDFRPVGERLGFTHHDLCKAIKLHS